MSDEEDVMLAAAAAIMIACSLLREYRPVTFGFKGAKKDSETDLMRDPVSDDADSLNLE